MNDRTEQFMRVYPAENEILEMEPEELGPFILRHLSSPGASLNRFNFFVPVPGGPIGERFGEAWAWLEREGFIAAVPTDQFGLNFFITRKGKRVLSAESFDSYMKASLFPDDLDPVIMRAVKPLFLRGDFDTAVFRAFKEVEVRVRRKGNLPIKDHGRQLMLHGFGTGGPLCPDGGHKDDQDALRELFCGAISFCKNRSSHHDVQFEHPREVIDLICFANQLLRIVDRVIVRA